MGGRTVLQNVLQPIVGECGRGGGEMLHIDGTRDGGECGGDGGVGGGGGIGQGGVLWISGDACGVAWYWSRQGRQRFALGVIADESPRPMCLSR